jgi:hypothetical protein
MTSNLRNDMSNRRVSCHTEPQLTCVVPAGRAVSIFLPLICVFTCLNPVIVLRNARRALGSVGKVRSKGATGRENNAIIIREFDHTPAHPTVWLERPHHVAPRFTSPARHAQSPPRRRNCAAHRRPSFRPQRQIVVPRALIVLSVSERSSPGCSVEFANRSRDFVQSPATRSLGSE